MVLPDGTYDVIVVDATEDPATQDPATQDPATEDPAPATVHVSVTILTGEHKSEVVDLAVVNFDQPAFDLLGLPGTLTVADGEPHLRIDH